MGLAFLIMSERKWGRAPFPPVLQRFNGDSALSGEQSERQNHLRHVDPRRVNCGTDEMFSGKRAFRGDTTADTLSAILSLEPPDLAETGRPMLPSLERIVRHCLEKNSDHRRRSALSGRRSRPAAATYDLPVSPILLRIISHISVNSRRRAQSAM